MTTATVTASSLNLRAKPGGAILGSLKRGTLVKVLEDHGDWLEVIAAGTRGFVAEGYVKREARPAEASPAPELPPEADERDLRVEGKRVLGPGGAVLGTLYKLGLYNRGRVSVVAFLQKHPALFQDTPQSLVRVMSAVSENEGALEAINTWDDCFLSFGSLQWTSGSGDTPGELGGLLARIQATHPDAFDRYFGRYGLAAAKPSTKPFSLDYSHLRLDGKVLGTRDAKAVLRRPIWAYRFWRAGHDATVGRCEIEHAIARLAVFYRRPQTALGGKSAADLVSSEWGVAHLFDQHTNRPGHVPATLVQAYRLCTSEGLLNADPAGWTTGDEAALMARYLELRHTTTSMTDSRGRAERLQRAVDAGRLSAARGSFDAP